jgi:anti-sigma factor RsiW
MNEKCLTDDEIAAYVDGAVTGRVRRRVEAHLSRCGLCLHSVAELKQLVDVKPGSVAVPTRAALARAESVIARYAHTEEPFDINVVLKKGICRILETTGSLLVPRRPSTVPVRGRKRGVLAPRIAKSLAGYHVTVELAPGEETLKPTLTLVEEATATRPDGVKAKLYTPGRCETKYSHKGKITFPPLKPGAFRIEIEEIGTIGLDIQ